MKSLKNIFSKYIFVSIFFLFASTMQIKSGIPPIKNLYNILKYNDIGFGQALLHSNWIKYYYIYAPRDDFLRSVIRSWWTVLNNQDTEKLKPTIKGPVAVVSPAILGKLMAYVYMVQMKDPIRERLERKTSKGYKSRYYKSELEEEFKERKDRLINELITELYEPYKNHILYEIRGIQEVITELENTIQKLIADKEKKEDEMIDLEEDIKNLELEKKDIFDAIIKEVEGKIKGLNKRKQKKLRKNLTKKLKKQMIPELFEKQTKQNILKDEIKSITRKVRAKKEKIKEIEEKELKKLERIKGKERNIRGAIREKIILLLGYIEDSLKKEKKEYMPRITIAVLWAFFESKFSSLDAIKECLQEIQKGASYIIAKAYRNKIYTLLKEESLYSSQDYKEFENRVKEKEDDAKKYELIKKEYNLALESILARVRVGSDLPPEVTQGGVFSYKDKEGEKTLEFSNCFEAAFLDLVSILGYNPETREYNDVFFPQEIKRGEGFLALKQVLENPTSITSDDVMKEWIKIISGRPDIVYSREAPNGIGYEVRSRIKNFINLLKYLYSIEVEDSIEVEGQEDKNQAILNEIGKKLSVPNQREISFNWESGEVEIKIEYYSSDMVQYDCDISFRISYDIHTNLSCVQRDSVSKEIYPDDFVKMLLENILININKFNKLTPITTLLTDEDLLDYEVSFTPKFINFLYYSLNIANTKMKLNIVKDILEKGFIKDPNIRELEFKLIDKLKLSQDEYIKNELFGAIIVSGYYKKYKRLKDDILKDPSRSLIILCENGADIKKNDREMLYHELLKARANINVRTSANQSALYYALKNNLEEISQHLRNNKNIVIGGDVLEYVLSEGDKEFASYIMGKFPDAFDELTQVLIVNNDFPAYISKNEELAKKLLEELAGERVTDLSSLGEDFIEKTIRCVLKYEQISLGKKIIDKISDLGLYRLAEAMLLIALQEESKELVKYILEKFPRVDLFSRRNAFSYAENYAQKGDKEILRLFLENLKKREEICSYFATFVYYGWELRDAINAAIRYDFLDIASDLIDHPEMRENIKDLFRLRVAAKKGDRAVVISLLGKISELDDRLWSEASQEIFKILLEYVMKREDFKYFEEVAKVALGRGFGEVAKKIIDEKLDKKYFKVVAEVAIKNGFREIAKGIINKMINQDHLGDLFVIAAVSNDLDTMKSILSKNRKIDVNYRHEDLDSGDITALQVAVQEGNEEIVRFLLSIENIDPEYMTVDLGTPLSLALKKGFHTIAKMLLEDPRVEWDITDDDLEKAKQLKEETQEQKRDKQEILRLLRTKMKENQEWFE